LPYLFFNAGEKGAMAMASLYQLEQKQLSALYDSLPRERRHLLIKQAQEYLESLDKAITYSIPLLSKPGALCPECGSKLVERKTRRGRIFYGCINYLECNFVT